MSLCNSVFRFSAYCLVSFRYYQNRLVRSLLSPLISVPSTSLSLHKILIIGDSLATAFGDLSTSFVGQGGIAQNLQNSIQATPGLRQTWNVYNLGSRGSTPADWLPSGGQYKRVFGSRSSYRDAEFIIICLGNDDCHSSDQSRKGLKDYESSASGIVSVASALHQAFPEKKIFVVTPLCPPDWSQLESQGKSSGSSSSSVKSAASVSVSESASPVESVNSSSSSSSSGSSAPLNVSHSSIHLIPGDTSSHSLKSLQLHRNQLIVRGIQAFLESKYPEHHNRDSKSIQEDNGDEKRNSGKSGSSVPEYMDYRNLSESPEGFPLDRPNSSAANDSQASNLTVLLDSSIYPAYFHNPEVYSSGDRHSLTSTGYRWLSRDLFQLLVSHFTRLEWKTWPLILEEKDQIAEKQRKRKQIKGY